MMCIFPLLNLTQIFRSFCCASCIAILPFVLAFRYKGALDADLVTRAICSGFVERGDSDPQSQLKSFFVLFGDEILR